MKFLHSSARNNVYTISSDTAAVNLWDVCSQPSSSSIVNVTIVINAKVYSDSGLPALATQNYGVVGYYVWHAQSTIKVINNGYIIGRGGQGGRGGDSGEGGWPGANGGDAIWVQEKSFTIDNVGYVIGGGGGGAGGEGLYIFGAGGGGGGGRGYGTSSGGGGGTGSGCPDGGTGGDGTFDYGPGYGVDRGAGGGDFGQNGGDAGGAYGGLAGYAIKNVSSNPAPQGVVTFLSGDNGTQVRGRRS